MRIRNSILVLIALAGLVLAPPAVEAQTIYTAKFVCGYELGSIPLNSSGTFDEEYEDAKPGNYATLINIFNAMATTQDLSAIISVEGYPLAGLALPALPALQTTKVGCTDIAPALAPPPTGGFIEGYVTIFTEGNTLEVDAVYTYKCMDAFKEFQYRGLLDDGTLGPALSLSADGLKFGTFPNVANYPTREIAGAGAGGLGVGVSIDVEEVEPRQFDDPTGMVAALLEELGIR